MKKKVAVLGATGSIGKSTLDVLRNHADRFEPVLFTANKNAEELLSLKKEFPCTHTALANNAGNEGLLDAIAAAGADITVNGIAGAAGLLPSQAAIKAGSALALANKETVVMAGALIFALAKEHNVPIIPVDSEHSALFRLLHAHGRDNVSELILTASGGPFRNFSLEELRQVKPEDALAHPTWKMGPKITIDSATLANKGLEVIEASLLFDFPPDKIKVLVHPQSIVHSMVRLKNGAVYAQMSNPDMRFPIQDALFWPDTENSSFGVLDFENLSLSFEKPDPEKFPMLALAYEVLKGGPELPVIYNAANEVAVEAFIKRRIGFTEIPQIVSEVLQQNLSGATMPGNLVPRGKELDSIEAVLLLDKDVRKLAEKLISEKKEKP